MQAGTSLYGRYHSPAQADHRIGLSLYSLDTFIMGDIEAMTEALAVAEREAQLAGEE